MFGSQACLGDFSIGWEKLLKLDGKCSSNTGVTFLCWRRLPVWLCWLYAASWLHLALEALCLKRMVSKAVPQSRGRVTRKETSPGLWPAFGKVLRLLKNRTFFSVGLYLLGLLFPEQLPVVSATAKGLHLQPSCPDSRLSLLTEASHLMWDPIFLNRGASRELTGHPHVFLLRQLIQEKA